MSCVIGLKASFTGITITALGTSLPHTFTSRSMTLHDKYADAAIGNVTGQSAVLTSSILIPFHTTSVVI